MKRFRYTAFIIMAALFLASCAMPEAPTKTALVFGIATYRENISGYPNLSLTDDDAEDMTNMLMAQGWEVFKSIANTNNPILNSATSKTAIGNAIANLDNSSGLVLFYYSGHGYIYGNETYICPYGSIVTGNQLLLEQMITKNELYDMFAKVGVKNVIIILDSCNSGGFVYEGATVDAVSPLFGKYDETGEYYNTQGDVSYSWFIDSLGDTVKSYISYENSSSYVVISAAGAKEDSWEGGNNGIFTAAILASQKSSNADRDGNGYVDTTELYIFCAETINSGWNSLGTYPSGNWDVFFPHLSGTPREYALWETK